MQRQVDYLRSTYTTNLSTPCFMEEQLPRPLRRFYDDHFVVTDAYRETLPDMQNAGVHAIEGSPVPILQVGISNFKLPLRYPINGSDPLVLETSVTGTVSLAAESKGINMSRIMRTFYRFKDELFSLELLEAILLAYQAELQSSSARIRLQFNYPLLRKALRSDLLGYSYYPVVYEGLIDSKNHFKKRIHFDFTYCSTCPCSAELAEHARETRDIYSIPHSQRSKARILVEIKPGLCLRLEELYQHCVQALKTETQVMVRREDEQAFAELNGAYVKFVEDAARLLFQQLDQEARIQDFQVACSHLESLHAHDAVAVINKGIPGGFAADFSDFASLVC